MRRISVLTWFMLLCLSYGHAATYYVSINGNDAGDGSAGNPWRSLRYALTRVAANQGHTINISAGTFVEGSMTVPAGVSINGAGIDQTIIKAVSSFYYNPPTPGFGLDRFLIQVSSPNWTGGNQSLKNFTVDGDGKRLHGGILVRFRSNVLIENVKVQYCNFSGIWLWDIRDSQVKNSFVTNSAWGSTGWCSGAFNIANATNVDIDNVDVDENTGYGIKSLGPNLNVYRNVKIHDCRVSVNPVGIWNNGQAPNISIELWANDFPGCEIYNCYIDNFVSLVNNTNGIPPTGNKFRIHHNVFDLTQRANGRGYAMELAINDAEIDHNFINGGSTGFVNWGHTAANWDIHHNTFYGIYNAYPTAAVTSFRQGVRNVNLYNNTIEMVGTSTVSFFEVNNGGVAENINIKNNLIINSVTSSQWFNNKLVSLQNGASARNLQVANNLLWRVDQGTIPGSYVNNITAKDPNISKSGARPSPYYVPAATSPVVDAGVNVGFAYEGAAPDIGAFEFASTAPPPANTAPTVSISSPANNAQATAGNTLTVNATAADANGTVSRVEFYAGTTKLGEDLSSPYSYAWSNVAAGTYALTAKATDNNGAVTTSSPVSVVVSPANVAPTVSLTAPANNTLYNTGATATLTANAADSDGSVTKVEFYNGTLKLGEDLTAPYSFAWGNLPNGSYTLTAKATDNRNAVTTSAAITITVTTSNNPPTVSITSPGNNHTANAGSTITLTANATDANGSVSKVEFFDGNTKLGEDTSSPYSLAWAGVTAGTHTISAKATDNQNAVATSAPVTVIVTVANAMPTVSLTAPANNASYSEGSSVTLAAVASDANGSISKVEFYNGTTKLGEDATPPYTYAMASMRAGTYNLTARAIDNQSGAATSAPNRVTVIATNPAPTVSLTSPASNAVFVSGTTIAIAATAADANGTVTKVEFYNGATKLGEDATAPYSMNWISVPTGTYSLTARATDNQNAITTSAARTIVVSPSPTPPQVAITSPGNNATFLSGNTVTIAANATATNATISKVEFYNGSTKLGEDATSPYSYAWGKVQAGSYSLTAKAIDSKNIATVSQPVNIIVNAGSAAPTINITSPAMSTVFASGSSITIAANASVTGGRVARVEFFSGNTKLGEDATAPYSFVWNNVLEGTYQIVARASDGQGTTATDQVQVFVNSEQAPQADAGIDLTLQLPDNSLTIEGKGTDANGVITAYGWKQVSGPTDAEMNADNFGNVLITDLKEGTYVFELTVTDNENLTGSDEVTITVVASELTLAKIPRYFSPNNDGVNDTWTWPRIEQYENSQLTVFNRFGQKVFESTSYENNWDGTLNGRPLQDDAYYYVIKLASGDVTGAVRIIR